MAHYANELATWHLLDPLDRCHVDLLLLLGALALLYRDELDLLGLELASLPNLAISWSQQWLIVLKKLAAYELAIGVLDLDGILEVPALD